MLKNKSIPQTAKEDFEEFWKQAVGVLRQVPISFTREKLVLPYKTFDTLSYFDINNLASSLKVPLCHCLGLADPICIPEFVYSMYHHTAGLKKLYMYPFVPHTIAYEHHLRLLTEYGQL